MPKRAKPLATEVAELYPQLVKEAETGWTVMQQMRHSLHGWEVTFRGPFLAELHCEACASVAKIGVVSLQDKSTHIILVLPDGSCKDPYIGPYDERPCQWWDATAAQSYTHDAPDGLGGNGDG